MIKLKIEFKLFWTCLTLSKKIYSYSLLYTLLKGINFFEIKNVKINLRSYVYTEKFAKLKIKLLPYT